MSDNDLPQTTRPAGEPEPNPLPVPVEARWEVVLERASAVSRGAAQLPPPPAAPSRLAQLAKLAFPLLIVAAYVGYRVYESAQRPAGRDVPGLVAPASALTPAERPRRELDLEGATRAFVQRLEELAAQGRWPEVAAAALNAPPESAPHPVVRAFGAVARVKTGGGGVELERELQSLEAIVARESRFAALAEQLRVARAQVMVRRLGTGPELLDRNLDTLRQLLSGVPLREETVKLRLDLARVIERVADEQAERARGWLQDDGLLQREARARYQSALRWIVVEDRWHDLVPVSEGARASVERIVGKIRAMNQQVHPWSPPLSGLDRSTWSGKAGEPIHDLPAVRP